MHAYLRSLALGLALLLPAVPAFAADAPAKTDAAIPRQAHAHHRTQYAGGRGIRRQRQHRLPLATRVKETLNSSNLFSLTDKDTPKIRILIATQPEFKDRPGRGLGLCGGLGLLPVGEHPAPLSDPRSRRRHAG